MQITTLPGDLDDETGTLCFAVADEDTGKRLDVVLTGASEALGEVFSAPGSRASLKMAG